jgi:ABC-2 type transport system ATP-binding protein
MAATPPAGVCVRDLTKRYGLVAALNGVSFDTATGEIFGLLGPNGAGKTTAIECILGLRRPDSGAITVGGVDALAHPEKTRLSLGVQLQGAALQDKISPRQALGLFASFYPESADVDGLLERFGLGDKAEADFDTLSGGQQQRLFLALAFVNNPRVVVLDEPTAGLDPHARRELHRVIVAMRDSGRTILLSTHHLEEAQQLCDRIAIVDSGRIVAIGTPAELVGRSRRPARVSIQTIRPLTAAQAGELAEVVSVRPQGDGWMLNTNHVTRTIVAVTRLIERDGNELVDLQIHRPSLEDVFLELTGKAWSAVDKSNS